MSNNNSDGECLLFRLWFVGIFFRIGSDYVSDGDIRYQKKVAPFRDWWISLFPSIAVSLFFVILLLILDFLFCKGTVQKTKPAEYFLGVMASFLGFGIGVYALIFSVSSDILKSMQSEHHKMNQLSGEKSTVLSLNSEFAFPLIILLLTCFVLIFQFIFSDNFYVKVLSWFFIFFSLCLMGKLILSLYDFGKLIILEKL